MIDITVKPRGGNVRPLARSSRQRLEQLVDIARQTGVPAAQRDPELIERLKVPQIGAAPRTADFTVRKLTRVERMARAGVLEPHEVDACQWFADIAALAWDTTGCTANYEGGSGGGGAHAPDHLMAKNEAVAHARNDYRAARALMPGPWADLFEGVVCRNEALGPAAATAFPTLQRSAAGDRARTVLKFCANKLHERFGRSMGWRDAPVVKTAAPVAGPTAVAPPAAPRELMPEIQAAIQLRAIAGAPAGELWMAQAIHDALVRELGTLGRGLCEVGGVPVRIREGWSWGWVLVDEPA